jgi:hypothetical protein
MTNAPENPIISSHSQNDLKAVESSISCLLAPLSIFFVIFLTSLFLLTAPWRVLELGGDEGVDFSKMVLAKNHPDLLYLVQDDQPWFYQKLFASIFSCAGTCLWLPRAVSAVLSAGMLFSFFRFIPGKVTWVHLVSSWASFLCWPSIPHYLFSGASTTSASAIAIIALAFSPSTHKEYRCWRFIFTAFLFAFALQINFAAATALPAFLAKAVFVRFGKESSFSFVTIEGVNRSRLYYMLSILTFLLSLAIINSWVGNALPPLHVIFSFNPNSLLRAPATLIAAVLGAVILQRQKELPYLIPLLSLLIAALIAHINELRFNNQFLIATPLAVLTGCCVGAIFNGLHREMPIYAKDIRMMMGFFIIALWACFGLPQAYAEMEYYFFNQNNQVVNIEQVGVLREYKEKTRWIYTRHNILAAESGEVLPPELTAISRKTPNSVDYGYVLKIVIGYKCELLVLNSEELKLPSWADYIKNNYVSVWSDSRESIFVINQLNPKPARKKEDVLNELGR